jgi:hypothetical protein
LQAADAALAVAEAEEQRQQAAARELFAKVDRQQQQRVSAEQQQRQPGSSDKLGHSPPATQQQLQADVLPTRDGAAAAIGAGSEACAGADAAAAAAGDHAEEAGRSPASMLAMPPQLQQRATRELKIHKHQV